MPGASGARRRGHVPRARPARRTHRLSLAIAAASAPDSLQDLARTLEAVLLDVEQVARIESPGSTRAAVLVALYAGIGAGPSTPTEHESPQRMPELHAVFTRRRGDLRRHAGEISFPGGRLEPEDADLPAAALREAEEEIGLPREEAILVGALTPASTFVTGYAIYPFVGLLRPGRPWMPSPTEVDAVLEFPLRVLRDARQQVSVSPRGVSFLTDAYVVGEHSIWGATARIVDDLLARLAAVPQLLV